MKAIYSLLSAVLLCSCASRPGPVAPKPDIGRVIVANEKTKQSIKKTGEQLKPLQDSQTKVSGSLQDALNDINKLLGQ